MSPHTDKQPVEAQATMGFPMGKALTLLIAVSVASLGVCWGLLSIIPKTAADAAVTTIAFSALNLLAAICGIFLVAMVARKTAVIVMAAYLGGATIRIMLNLLAVVALAMRPADHVAILAALVAGYLPLLIVEAGFVGRFLWNKSPQSLSHKTQFAPKSQQSGHSGGMTNFQITEALA